MTTAVVLDADFINYIAKVQLNSLDPATGLMDDNLDALIANGSQVLLTSTVIAEMTSGATDKQPAGVPGYPKDDLVEAWINKGLVSGQIREVKTPSFPPGKDNGEKASTR